VISGLIALAIARPDDPAAWGRETLAVLRQDFYMAETRLVSERANREDPAFNWGVGVMLSALNAAATYDDKYKSWLKEYTEATRIYWNQGGYDVLPVPKPRDRYYDDNAWMALALIETYEVLGEKRHLDWARGALEFALSGESPQGGIFWRESDKASRNTCSNGPTAFACLRMYALTGDQKWRDRAKRLVAWTREHLEDPADGLFWDALGNDGRTDKTKWSYNTALMLRAMHAIGEPGVAKAMEASKARWLVDGRLTGPGRFGHLLLEAWAEIEGKQPEHVLALRRAWEARNARGHLPPDWSKVDVPENPELLDQAAFVRACFLLAD
jgi:hypothetical protein